MPRLESLVDHLPGDGIGNARVRQLFPGQVDRDVQVEPRVAPRPAIARALGQDRPGELADLRVVFQQAQEGIRQDDPVARMPPPGQCFRTLDATGAQFDLGLVERLELVRAQSRQDLVQGKGRRSRPRAFGIRLGPPVQGDQFRQLLLREGFLDRAQQAHAVRRAHRLDGVEQGPVQAAGDDQRGADARLPEAPDERQAVHAGHVDVGDDDVEGVLQFPGDLHGGAAILGLVHARGAQVLEHLHEHAALELVVFGHQEAKFARGHPMGSRRVQRISVRRDRHSVSPVRCGIAPPVDRGRAWFRFAPRARAIPTRWPARARRRTCRRP